MSEVFLAVLAITVLLVLVSALLPLAERISLPHTLLLAVLGLGLGFLAVGAEPSAGMGLVGDLLRGLNQLGLGADAYLVLFLPPLLFAAGLAIDVRLLLDEFAAVLLLAVVAVVVCTAVVGWALFAVSGTGLVACLLLGAIVAATDPAAVVGIFRDLGAPRRLTTLVAGESLFNDAAAIALFTILLDMLIGGMALDFGHGTLSFLAAFLGGAALGYGLARLACAMIARWRNVPVAEVTVTVALAYLSFILGESYLGVSGVVAVVSAALTFAIHGRTRLSPGTWEVLHQTWAHLEFWASSLIFVLAAMLAARVLPLAELADLGFLAAVVLAALAARGLVLYGLLPGLTAARLTQKVDAKYKAVILWGGVRGAVTLVLALSIDRNPFLPAEVRHFVAVLATGFVLFTLFVEAPSLKPLIRLLGLDQLSPIERALRRRVLALSQASVHAQIHATARDYGFDPALAAALAPMEDENSGAVPEDQSIPEELTEDERLKVGLLTLANRERELYLEHFAMGTVSPRMVGLRVAAADRLIDRVKATGAEGYAACAAESVEHRWRFRIALWLHRRYGWSRQLARTLADRFETLLITQLVVRELVRFNRRSVRPLLGQITSGRLRQLLEARLSLIDDAIDAVDLQYPSYATALRKQYLARAALRFEDAEYREKLEESLIGREVFTALQAELWQRRQALEQRPPLELGLALTEMIGRVALFAELDRARLETIAKLLKPRLAMPGERILRKGAHGKAMFFVASGEVEVALSGGPIKLGSGEFFGELALLTKKPRSADVTARGYCHLLVLEVQEFRRFLRGHPDMKKRIEAVAQQRLAAGGQAQGD